MSNSKPLTVTLGDQQQSVDARLAAGTYATASEVLRAALRALEREETTFDAHLKAKVEEAMSDRRPPLAARDISSRLDRKHAERIKLAR